MNNPAPVNNSEPMYKLYLAAAFGAFCLGFGDLLNNEHAATVLKISEIIKQNLYHGLENGGLFALIALTVIGGLICWVHQPQTRVDAFARGFSVFAVLAVVAPYQPVEEGLESAAIESASSHPTSLAILGISAAYADDTQSGNTVKQKITVTFNIITDESQPSTKERFVAVAIIRDRDTGRIVGRETVDRTFTISQPKGLYVIEIEASGYKRSTAEIEITESGTTHTMALSRSGVPMSIQRLYGPERLKLK